MFFVDDKGDVNQVEDLSPGIYAEAHKAKLSLPAYINRTYTARHAKVAGISKKGTPFQQMCASEGLILPGSKNPFGLTAPSLSDILTGEFSGNTKPVSTTAGGTASRILFAGAVVDMIESALAKDYETDTTMFDQMVAITLNIPTEDFYQPVVNYNVPNGPEGANRAKAQRISQLAEPAALVSFTTSDTTRKLPTWSIGAEFSQQALRATTLDLVVMNMARFMRVERDAMVYEFLSNMFAGDGDMNLTAITGVTTNSLDSAATGGVVTHRSWIKWLMRNKKFRVIDYAICDIDTYLKIEGRTGRPGSNSYDPSLARLDPQAYIQNPYVGNVKFFIVDSAADGGPVPANTVWGIDSRSAIVLVNNLAAQYTAAESFAMRRSEQIRMDWGRAAYRQYDMAFDVLTIS